MPYFPSKASGSDATKANLSGATFSGGISAPNIAVGIGGLAVDVIAGNALGGVGITDPLAVTKRITSGVVLAGSISGTYTTDASLGNELRITATANLTLANPTNPINGQVITWRITQPAAGNKTIT